MLALVLLADELDVPQLAKVEIPLPLQAVYCQLQVHQLTGRRERKERERARERQREQKRGDPWTEEKTREAD